jgi:short-subunit dehydrogenase
MSISLKPLDQQVIVITGASSGIGLATAISAAKAGAKVVLSARSEQTLNEVVHQISATGGQAIAVRCDVADRKQVEHLAQTAVGHFGRIDTWINDAGLSIYGRMDEVSDADFRRLFDTNFWGVVNGSLVALPYLKKQGGALINVGSEVSEAVVPLQGMYSASKHAVKGFTDALRVEIDEIDNAPVSITLIQPTAVNTPFPQHAKNYMDKEPQLPTPMIDPQKVADAILDAAVKPTRVAKVGMMAKVNTFMANNAPAIGEWVSGKQANRQQRPEPPRNPDGSLYIPSESHGQIYGEGASA